jgi:hypothetical protein
MPIKSNVVSGGGSSGSADPVVLAETTASVGQVQQTAGIRLLHLII